jgi:dTMP kinase
MVANNGKFIAFEGIDGSGKSSQIHWVKSKLEAAGHKVYTTFEPTDNKIGSIIRSILKGVERADHLTIAALFAADRLHHLLNEQDGILMKLADGYIVLTDRYYFSSYAYHSLYVDMDWVIEINKKSAELLRPDLNIFIDLSPELAMNRIESNRNQTELFETLDMLKGVYNNYQIAFDKMKDVEKIRRIDGDDNPDAIGKIILQEIERIL